MSTPGKIRVLLALLCAGLFFTAVIVQKTYTPVNNLQQTARTLEENLHKKEKFVNGFLNNPHSFTGLKSISANHSLALNLIEDFTTDKSIWFVTLNKGQLSFWSGVKVIPPDIANIKDGYSFRKESNGYYEEIKKTDGDFSAIFFIPVKLNYAFQNQYLQNTFAPDLLNDNSIAIADFDDHHTVAIRSQSGAYLFSVVAQKGEISHSFFYFELGLWVLTLIFSCVLIQNICNYIAGKGYVLISFFVLAAFIVLVRFLNLHSNWPDFTYRLEVFNPAIYASSAIYPSLGDLCINILLICWFVVFVYLQRNRLQKNAPGKLVGYLIITGCSFILIIISTALLNLFYGLVINSKINFDVSNVLNLSYFSALGIAMLCFSFLIFYLLIEVFLKLCSKVPVAAAHKFAIFITSILAVTAVATFYQGFTLFYVLWSLIVFIRVYDYKYHNGRLSAVSLPTIILICALISSIKLNVFESIKEKETRRALIQKLEVPDDVTADLMFKKIDKQIIADTSIIRYFKDSLHNSDYIKTRLQKLYFNGYLSKYDLKVYEFDGREQSATANKSELDFFKDKVLYSSYKVSNYFYRENDSFGFQNYFAILPLSKNNSILGTIVIELKSKPLQTFASFPGLLVDGQANAENQFKDYSYAFYSDNKLLSQYGDYVYSLTNTDFKGRLKGYVYKTTQTTSTEWFLRFATYNHLIYQPGKHKLIVVSKEDNALFVAVTSITFFCVLFLVFSVLVLLVRLLWLKMRILSIKNDRVRWNFRFTFDQLLYKTRIQFSMIFAVVATLIFVGFITFYSISTQYQNQQDKAIRDKITRIAAAFENDQYNKYLRQINESSQVEFNDFANTYSSDLTLYDTNGNALLTTQPKLFEFGLEARKMNGRAFIYLNKLQKSEYVNNEIIGRLNYKAAYVPLRNSRNEAVAYLQLPYFSNEADYKERIGSLINIMINVYALVFIAIGLFAVFIAQQITAPLNFIQHSLSKTIYGQKNEPIRWDRQDEIGGLVREYNKMISTLENSAQKLAQSERESAWREMAKQVAHEIKNPLTPLKLGLQLLDKSWRDKDPKFDQKFERFSKSFVEQIESLSTIASEFSAFAKMPDTRMERLNVFEIINQAVTIFKQMDNIKIVYQASEEPFFLNADRDQLLRCFNNLLKNAIEAASTERGGLIEISYLITTKNILITIKDNGNGIPELMREKIFEPNFTTKSSGTGLGLAFVKNSIENAGGKVWFDTATGEGTTFYLNLPAA